MLFSLWSEFGQHKRRKLSKTNPGVHQKPPTHQPASVEEIPMAEIVEPDPPPQPAPAVPPAQPARRQGTASHLRSLRPQELLHFLLGQLSAIMDSKDGPDWTVNPAYHPDVNAFIQKHISHQLFVQKARALQRNRAPYYAKMVVPGQKRKTILALGRTTLVKPQ